MLFDRLMKRTSFQTRLLFGLVLWTGITLCGVVSTHAQTRAIKPVRIEAKTAQNETVSYIYAESHALVIGVSQYRNGWSNLPGVQEDVEELSSALADNGFAVTVVEDPTLEEMEIAIEDFIFEKGANPDNRLLIYYAGHGHTMTLGYGGEMGYLVPADAPLPKKGRNTAFQRSVMSMQQVEVFAKNTSAKHVLFMFDACFAGSVFLATRAAPAYIQVYTKEPVRQFITSGSAEQEVPDKSIFRRAFVDALNGKADYDKDGYLTGSELGSYIQKRTAEDWKGNLTPQYGKLQDPNLNKGDFVFELSKPEVVKPPPAEPAPVAPPPDLAAQAWNIIEPSTDPAVFQAFVERFPDAPQRQLAELKLMVLPKASIEKTESNVSLDEQTKTERVDSIPNSSEDLTNEIKENKASLADLKQAVTTNNLKDNSQQFEQKTDSGAGRRYKWNPEVIEDRLMRVFWQRQPHLIAENRSYKTYGEAEKFCNDLNLSNSTGWRLPTRRELVSLFVESVPAKINLDLFSVDYRDEVNYWSKSFLIGETEKVWTIDFQRGEANSNSITSNQKTICLRDWNSSAQSPAKDAGTPSPPEKADPQIIGKGMDYSAYQAVEQNSSDVVGCGFFHVGCEEKALTFPAYQPGFHIKGYRRVNLWGKDRPWTDTEVYVEDGEIVYIFGTGAVKTCPSCLTEKLDRYTPLLTYKTGDRLPANIARFAGVQTNSQGYFSKVKIWAKDNTWSKDKFYLTIRDGDLSAASNSNYDDNSGIYILDIFVIDPDQEEGFNLFKDALFKANPNDSNAKAYLGR